MNFKELKLSLDQIVMGMFFLLFTLLIHGKVIRTLEVDKMIYGLNEFTEMFHQFKGHVLVLVVILLLFLSASDLLIRGRRLRLPRVMGVCLLVYAGLSVVSYILCQYKDLGWRGTLDHYEGLPVLLAYSALMIVAYLATSEQVAEIWIKYCLATNNLILFIIGIFQMAGRNVFNADWLLKLIIWPEPYTNYAGTEGGTLRFAYGTLGNQNFMGSYLALSLPLLLWSYVQNGKSLKGKLAHGIMLLLGLIVLLGSVSRAGQIGFAVGLPFALIVLRKEISNWKEWLVLGGIFAVAPCIATALSPEVSKTDLLLYAGAGAAGVLGLLGAGLLRVLKDRYNVKKTIVVGFLGAVMIVLVTSLLIFTDTSVKKTAPIKGIVIQGNELSIMVYGTSVSVGYSNGIAVLQNQSSGETVELNGNAEKFLKLNGGKTTELKLVDDKKNPDLKALIFKDFNLVFMLAHANGTDIIKLAGNGGIPIDPVVAPTFKPLDGYEALGSGRGYIWSRTIPLLPECFLIGKGPDHFITVFPQNDVAAKTAISNPYLIIDKPHNWYLQMAVNSGVIAMVSVLVLIGTLLYQGTRYYHNKTGPLLPVMLCISILSYAVSNLFNDSVISVAPLFWALGGIAYALLHKQIPENQKLKRV